MSKPLSARSTLPAPYAFVVRPGTDPLELIKRGIATTTLLAEWREEQPEDERLIRILCPITGPQTPSLQAAGGLHLTTIGWRRVRALVKKDLTENIRRGLAPSALFSFAEYEAALLPLLARVDRACVGMGYEDDLGIKMPYLLLAPQCDSEDETFPLLEHQITTVNHQGAGFNCSYRIFRGIVLRPNVNARRLATHLEHLFDGSSCSAPPTWARLQSYQSALEHHGLTCLVGYEELEESVYPISPVHVQGLAEEKMPADLAELIDWDSVERQHSARLRAQGVPVRRGKFWRAPVAWSLYLVTKNSD